MARRRVKIRVRDKNGKFARLRQPKGSRTKRRIKGQALKHNTATAKKFRKSISKRSSSTTKVTTKAKVRRSMKLKKGGILAAATLGIGAYNMAQRGAIANQYYKKTGSIW